MDKDRGRRIQLARIRKGFETQKDFAASIGISPSMVSFIEKGGVCSLKLVEIILKALDISYDYFAGREDTLNINK